MKKISFIILLLLIVGCSSSKITSSWRAKDVTALKYDNILVLGIIPEKDRSIQERMEQHVVADLTDMGYTAISALQQYGPKIFDSLSEKEVIQMLVNKDVDAIITIVLLGKKKERKYIPGRAYNSGEFWNYVDSRNRMIYEPGYYVTDTKYYWESNFYEMKNQRLLYSVQTRSFSPDTKESMSHEYGKLIVSDMVKQQVLLKKHIDEEGN